MTNDKTKHSSDQLTELNKSQEHHSEKYPSIIHVFIEFHSEKKDDLNDALESCSRELKSLSPHTADNDSISIWSNIGLIRYLQSKEKECAGSAANEELKKSIQQMVAKLIKDFPNTSSVYDLLGSPFIGKAAVELVIAKCSAALELFNTQYDVMADIHYILGVVLFDYGKYYYDMWPNSLGTISIDKINEINTKDDCFSKAKQQLSKAEQQLSEAEKEFSVKSDKTNALRVAVLKYYLAKATSKNETEYNDESCILYREAILKLTDLKRLPSNVTDVNFVMAVVNYSLGVLLNKGNKTAEAKNCFIEVCRLIKVVYRNECSEKFHERSKALSAELRQCLKNIYNTEKASKNRLPAFDKWLNKEQSTGTAIVRRMQTIAKSLRSKVFNASKSNNINSV